MDTYTWRGPRPWGEVSSRTVTGSDSQGRSPVTAPELEGMQRRQDFFVLHFVLPPPSALLSLSCRWAHSQQLLPSPPSASGLLSQPSWPSSQSSGVGASCALKDIHSASQPPLWRFQQHTSHPSWDNQKCHQDSWDPGGKPLGYIKELHTRFSRGNLKQPSAFFQRTYSSPFIHFTQQSSSFWYTGGTITPFETRTPVPTSNLSKQGFDFGVRTHLIFYNLCETSYFT